MTREEFIKKAEQKYLTRFFNLDHLDRNRIIKNSGNGNVIKDVNSVAKIIEFIDEFSMMHLFAYQNEEKDFVIKQIFLEDLRCEFWDDVVEIVIRVANMWNCSSKKIDFFMSETGVFYDETHKIIADDNDSFLEYLLDVPCDRHEIPDERTYRLLKEAGWYEGRREDITDIVAGCHQDGVELTEKQKEFISEFIGIRTEKFMIFDEYNYKYFSYRALNTRFKIDAVYIGIYNSELQLYLSTDGRIFKGTGMPWGLDAMEAIHIMLQ